MLDPVLGHRHHDQIREQGTVRVEVAGRDGRVLVRSDDENPAVGGDRRDRSAAPVEHDQVGPELLREPDAGEHVRDPDRTREPSAAATAADRRQAGQRRRLEVVGRGVAPVAGEREQVGHRGPDLDDLGPGGPSAPHRHDHDTPVAGEEPGHVPGHGGLPDALPGPDHGDGRRARSPRSAAGRAGSRLPRTALPARAHAPRAEAGGRPEHGLVREVEHDVGCVRGDRVLERGGERDAVVLAAAQLLGAADEHAGDDLVGQLDQSIPDHGGVVLPVDHGDGPHERVVTSDSIRPVYFSYSKVSVENWMMRSCP